MNSLSVINFALAIAVATASPGPTIVALVARVLGKGSAGIPAFCVGLLVGDLIWFSAAVFGLAILMQTAQPVFEFLKYAGAAYLTFLAWKLWTAPAFMPGEATAISGEGWRLLFGGIALALGNPKTMIFYVALAPAIVDMNHLAAGGFAVLAATLTIVYGAVLASYVGLAGRARRMIRNNRAIKIINRTTGGVMAGAAVLVATR